MLALWLATGVLSAGSVPSPALRGKSRKLRNRSRNVYRQAAANEVESLTDNPAISPQANIDGGTKQGLVIDAKAGVDNKAELQALSASVRLADRAALQIQAMVTEANEAAQRQQALQDLALAMREAAALEALERAAWEADEDDALMLLLLA